MRKLFLLLTAICIVGIAAAQTRTADYMKKIPALPKDSCNVTKASAENFRDQVSVLGQELQNEIDAINEKVNRHMEANAGTAQDKSMQQMSQMYGISQADIDKMKNSKNMTAAEKQALASKMMSQQTNMTMDEAKNVSKMSDAGKKAYTEAYAMEAMATAQADPNQQAKNENAQNMYQSVTSQQAANSKITEITNRINALYSPIQGDPERQKSLDRIDGWHEKIMSMTGIATDRQAKQMDSLAILIKNEKIAYCNKYTPKYRNALRKHLEIMKTSMPDYRKFGDITAEATKAQTGIEMPAEARELPALQAISDYLRALRDAYTYKLYYPEDDF